MPLKPALKMGARIQTQVIRLHGKPFSDSVLFPDLICVLFFYFAIRIVDFRSISEFLTARDWQTLIHQTKIKVLGFQWRYRSAVECVLSMFKAQHRLHSSLVRSLYIQRSSGRRKMKVFPSPPCSHSCQLLVTFHLCTSLRYSEANLRHHLILF